MPISSRPVPKSRFVASKWEHKKVRAPSSPLMFSLRIPDTDDGVTLPSHRS